MFACLHEVINSFCLFREATCNSCLQIIKCTIHTRINLHICELHVSTGFYKQNRYFMNSFMSSTVPAIFHFPSEDSCMPQQPGKYKSRFLKFLLPFLTFKLSLL